MKNIYEILEESGIAVAQEKKADFEKLLFASYKSAAEVEKKEQKITNLQQEVDQLRAIAAEAADTKALTDRIAELENALEQQKIFYDESLQERDFSAALEGAIAKAKGRNTKAILALLDRETLKSSQDREKDISAALEALKKTDAYLFEDPHTPPPYARGTGAYNGPQDKHPTTLAGALREKFERK